MLTPCGRGALIRIATGRPRWPGIRWPTAWWSSGRYTTPTLSQPLITTDAGPQRKGGGRHSASDTLDPAHRCVGGLDIGEDVGLGAGEDVNSTLPLHSPRSAVPLLHVTLSSSTRRRLGGGLSVALGLGGAEAEGICALSSSCTHVPIPPISRERIDRSGGGFECSPSLRLPCTTTGLMDHSCSANAVDFFVMDRGLRRTSIHLCARVRVGVDGRRMPAVLCAVHETKRSTRSTWSVVGAQPLSFFLVDLLFFLLLLLSSSSSWRLPHETGGEGALGEKRTRRRAPAQAFRDRWGPSDRETDRWTFLTRPAPSASSRR